MKKTHFEWDDEKDKENHAKHKVPFSLAQRAFLDPKRVIAEDISHSSQEARFYCIGQVEDGVITVRFTFRGQVIRIFGAGYWRKGKKIYEEQNKIH
ncbi:MAG: BrnT family toxin [Nitrospiria bacterium]